MKIAHANTLTFTLALPILLVVLAAGGCANSNPYNVKPVAASPRNDPQADLKIADSALAGGNTDLAGTLYAKILAAHPDSVDAQLGLADVAYQTGDLNRAQVLYAQAAALAPSQLGAQLGLARVALRQRRLDDAAALYRTLLAAQPNNVLASEGLGTALDLQGRHGEAQAVYREALRVHPDAQGLRVDLGLSLIVDGHPREGVNVLLDVANLPDAPWQARQNLALGYGVLGNADSAKKILQLDLPPSAVDDNLRVYQAVRDGLATRPRGAAAAVTKTPGVAESNSTQAAAQATAQAGPDTTK
ncbi:tetratricopeptide repeat protein [Trinickia sp. YCB016]